MKKACNNTTQRPLDLLVLSLDRPRNKEMMCVVVKKISPNREWPVKDPREISGMDRNADLESVTSCHCCEGKNGHLMGPQLSMAKLRLMVGIGKSWIGGIIIIGGYFTKIMMISFTKMITNHHSFKWSTPKIWNCGPSQIPSTDLELVHRSFFFLTIPNVSLTKW